MIGLRVGIKAGSRIGAAVGIGADPISAPVSGGGMTGVAQDATSGKYVPANAAQWSTTLATALIGSGGPTSLWLGQEPSGNLADSIGANALTKFGSPTYQNAVAGWARTATRCKLNTDAFYNTGIGNLTTTSHLVIAYLALSGTPAAAKNVINVGSAGTNSRHAKADTTPVYTLTGDNSQATGTGAANPGTSVRPVILQVDRGNGAVRVITDQEVIAPAYTAPAGTGTYFSIGNDGSGDTAVSLDYLYLVMFTGTAAELSTAQIKALLQTLGWTVSW